MFIALFCISFEYILDESFLIGVTDSFIEGKWMYASSMQLVQSTDWRDNEPNNYAWEDCVQMEPPTGKWADINCDRQSQFICEKLTKETLLSVF